MGSACGCVYYHQTPASGEVRREFVGHAVRCPGRHGGLEGDEGFEKSWFLGLVVWEQAWLRHIIHHLHCTYRFIDHESKTFESTARAMGWPFLVNSCHILCMSCSVLLLFFVLIWFLLELIAISRTAYRGFSCACRSRQSSTYHRYGSRYWLFKASRRSRRPGRSCKRRSRRP